MFGFDTGFVAYYRGWHPLRREDLGTLWEHFVLNELHASLQTRGIRYWRDKQGHEVDFVVRAGRALTAIEVKSGRGRDTHPGLAAIAAAFRPTRTLLVGGDGIRPEEFLLNPVAHWVTR